MKTRLIVWFVLLVVGFLFGFVPQYHRAARLQGELATKEASVSREHVNGQLCEARADLRTAYYEAMLKNYGIASDYFNRFYAVALAVRDQTQDSALKGNINDALSSRDQIAADLGKGDPSVVSKLKTVLTTSDLALRRDK